MEVVEGIMKTFLGISLLILIVLIGCIIIFPSSEKPTMPNSATVSMIKTLWVEQSKGHRILFGHQSVGDNILAGIRELGIQPNMTDIHIGQNQDPQSKIKAFEAAITNDYDIAMMKFCYVDLPLDGISPEELFQEYRAIISIYTSQLY